MTVSYTVSEIKDYINWVYFFHAWGFGPRFSTISHIHACDACRHSWVESFAPQDRPRASEALRLYQDATSELSHRISSLTARGVFRLMKCHRDCDDIVLEVENHDEYRLPMLRSLHPDSNGYCLCLSDFLHDKESGGDMIGLFATTIEEAVPPVSASQKILSGEPVANKSDDYRSLLFQTLSDRLAEAAAERLHEQVRKQIWGYAPNENLSINQLHSEQYQGIRPAVGYPCMPDMSLNFLLDELLGFSSIGIHLTENGMMNPHASVSGLMISDSRSHYFNIGGITEEQLDDYAHRRQMSKNDLIRFLKLDGKA